jgi:hypothetical protein
MQIDANSIEEYLDKIPEERKEAFGALRQTILNNIPEGFREEMTYGMIGYVVPHSIYPAGYHVTPEQPLPFACIASQKNFIALYHSGIYADQDIYRWFVEAFPKHSKLKLDMGKSCIRFKKVDQIPLALIGELMQKMTVQQFIDIYEQNVKKRK